VAEILRRKSQLTRKMITRSLGNCLASGICISILNIMTVKAR
jgi:hypothetical protein